MPAEYYIDCIRIVFQEHLLARGLWSIEGERVAPEKIENTQLLTVEASSMTSRASGKLERRSGCARAFPTRTSTTCKSKVPAITGSSVVDVGVSPSTRAFATSLRAASKRR